MNKTVWIWNHDATCMFSNQGGRHYWFAKNMLDNHINPVIFCSNINHFNGEKIYINKKFKVDYVKKIPFVFVKTTSYKGNGISRIKNWFSFYVNLFPTSKAIADKYGRPDIILASSVHPLTMVAGIQIAKYFKIPCICEIRDLWPEAIFNVNKASENSLLGKILVKGEHWIYRNADSLIFTKEGDTDYLKEKGWFTCQGGDIDLKKCHYINNGLDLDQYLESMKEYTLQDEDLESKKFKIIYTGTIRKVNNLELVLNSAVLLKDYHEIVFLIYGAGDYLDALKEKVKSSGLQNIVFKGYVNKRFVPYILSQASVALLHYSQNMYNWSRGNSSNKLFEYMASGKPILSTVKMGYSLIERYHCGFTLNENTAECLAETILKIKDYPCNQLAEIGQNARKGAEDFDFRKLTQKLLDIVNSLTT